MIKVTYEKNLITINDKVVTLEYPIKEAFVSSEKVIVLLDPDSNMGASGQFKNLISLDRFGKINWIADLPTEKNTDVYYKIKSERPLQVFSFCSYRCEIDVDTGQIKAKEFLK